MRFSDLDPHWVFFDGNPTLLHYVETRAQANGVIFLCPACFKANSGPVGTHSVICWFEGVPQTIEPTPGRWKATGSSFNDLTLSPSVNVDNEHWHGFIQNGLVT